MKILKFIGRQIYRFFDWLSDYISEELIAAGIFGILTLILILVAKFSN